MDSEEYTQNCFSGSALRKGGKLFLVMVVALLICLSTSYCYRQSATPVFDRASGNLFPDLVGYGLDPRHQDVSRYYPMAYALYAWAQAIHAKKTNSAHARSNAEIAARWLINHSDLNGDSTVGWGLPFAWDAFGDGSTNPANTVYGITTALSVYALLEVFDLTGKKEFLSTALDALDGYITYFTALPDGTGYFWYSERSDDSHPVPNVSSMLAGAYAQAGSDHWKERVQDYRSRCC